MLTRYQYIKAVEAAGGKENKVDAELFRYPGPRPQSRETALIMLADACEAQVRAERPKDENELRQLIRNAIDARVKSGQLDNTELTLRDLDTICDSFAATLRGLFHRRILYPKLKGESKEPARRLRSEVPTAPKPGKPHDQDIP
jgi:membrane-associated HD superfamily phosphohydrolase